MIKDSLSIKVNQEFEKEVELEKAVGHYFLEHGFFCQKTPKLKTYGNRKLSGPLSLNGSPDLYLIVSGFYVGLEIKLINGRQSDFQKEFERLIRKAGGLYFKILSLEDARIVHLALKERFNLR